jgi:hypothetical protein
VPPRLPIRNGRAPSVEPSHPAYWTSLLQPGTPAAPRRDRLPLLPPGPGGVHGLLPRRTQPSTPLNPAVPTDHEPSRGSSIPLRRILRVQGTASSPSSTTGGIVSQMRGQVKQAKERGDALPTALQLRRNAQHLSRLRIDEDGGAGAILSCSHRSAIRLCRSPVALCHQSVRRRCASPVVFCHQSRARGRGSADHLSNHSRIPPPLRVTGSGRNEHPGRLG